MMPRPVFQTGILLFVATLELPGAGAYVMKNRYSVEATSKPPSSRHPRARKVGGGSSNNNKQVKPASKSQHSGSGSIAHEEANELLSFISKNRLDHKSPHTHGDMEMLLMNNETLNMSLSRHQYYSWERETTSEWTKPYLNVEEFQKLPDNHQYLKYEWFTKYNATQLQRLRRSARVIYL
jgi:hypothetical protein